MNTCNVIEDFDKKIPVRKKEIASTMVSTSWQILMEPLNQICKKVPFRIAIGDMTNEKVAATDMGVPFSPRDPVFLGSVHAIKTKISSSIFTKLQSYL